MFSWYYSRNLWIFRVLLFPIYVKPCINVFCYLISHVFGEKNRSVRGHSLHSVLYDTRALCSVKCIKKYSSQKKSEMRNWFRNSWTWPGFSFQECQDFCRISMESARRIHTGENLVYQIAYRHEQCRMFYIEVSWSGNKNYNRTIMNIRLVLKNELNRNSQYECIYKLSFRTKRTISWVV